MYPPDDLERNNDNKTVIIENSEHNIKSTIAENIKCTVLDLALDTRVNADINVLL